MNKGDLVILVRKDDRRIARLNIGQKGIILAIRNLPSDDEPKCLVKWEGKSGPVSLSQSQVKEI